MKLINQKLFTQYLYVFSFYIFIKTNQSCITLPFWHNENPGLIIMSDDTIDLIPKSNTNSASIMALLSACLALFALGINTFPAQSALLIPKNNFQLVFNSLCALSAIFAILAALFFSKTRSQDRLRRMKLAKALDKHRKKNQEISLEISTQLKISETLTQDIAKEKEIAQNYLDVANIFLAALDIDGNVEVINKKGLEVLGCSEKEIIGQNFAKFCIPEPYRDKVSDEILLALRAQKPILARTEYPISTVIGERLISWSNALVRDAQAKPKALLLCGEDVTDRRSVESRLQLMRLMLESVDEGVITIDNKGVVIWANPACERITGFTVKAIQGRPISMLYPSQNDSKYPIDISQAMNHMLNAGNWKGDILSSHKNGKRYPQLLSLSTIKDSNSAKVTHAVAVFSDISKEKEQEERVRYLATHDTLTGLPNRAKFTSKLDEALTNAKNNSTKIAILFIDLDHFKKVNDTLGHEAGDHLLVEVAQRMKSTLREKDFIARLGGDEFTAIIENFSDIQDAQHSAQKLLASLSEKYQAIGDNSDIRVTPSIGICLYPEDGTDAQSLLKKSDQAMYAVKSSGRAGVRFFTPDINAKELHYAQLEAKLRKAIADKSLHLYYQPKINLKTHNLHGFEALIRWNDEHGTAISPDEFIIFAEETGLIIDIGHWALETACAQILSWKQAGFANINIAVNVSAKQFKDETFYQKIQQLVSTYDIKPMQLELEITEGSLMNNNDDATLVLQRFKNLGCTITIDDFGMGYSSLNRLRSLPVDCVKIDKEFVINAISNQSDQAICTAVVGLAKAFELSVVAEGVESPEHLQMLSAIGADFGQGYFFSQAMDKDEATLWLHQFNKK